MSFKEHDTIKVITKNSMHYGTMGRVIRAQDDGTYFVNLFTQTGVLTGFFESELALFDSKREALIALAETLDSARKQANDINGADGTIYQNITTPLISVLDSLVPVDATGYDAYEFIIEDGLSVREALKKVEK